MVLVKSVKPLTLIMGGPKAGKTTRAGADARHTDDLGRDRSGWDQRLDTVAAQIRGGSGIIEGAILAHALRRVLREDPNLRLDHVNVEYLSGAHAPMTPRQAGMQKAVRTVFDEIKPELQRRGARITEL